MNEGNDEGNAQNVFHPLSAGAAGAIDPAGSPFAPASEVPIKRKVFAWGDSGSGKTTFALQFPRPVMLDLDGGANLYGAKYDFGVFKTTNLIDIKKAVMWLINNSHGYETLIIDPITIYWELLQKWWSDVFISRNKGYKANKHEFYDLGPKEWSAIKHDFRRLFDKLLSLDMNIVVTCREKDKVAYQAGEFASVGVRPDCEKGIPYLFDVVLHLYKDDAGVFWGNAQKDRTESLPEGAFKMDFAKMCGYLSIPYIVPKNQQIHKIEEKKDGSN